MTLAPGAGLRDPQRLELRARIEAFLDQASQDLEADRGADRDGLLAAAASFQRQHVAPFSRLCAARGARFDEGPAGWPALPTDVFRHARVSTFEPGADVRTFRTSGTTSGARGEHPFVELALYDRVAQLAGDHAFLDPERVPLRAADLVLLSLEPMAHVESSLSHMLALFGEILRVRDPGTRVTWALAGDQVDVPALQQAIDRAIASDRAVILCATSFALVFAEDMLGDRRFVLPAGSRVMLTGGFKGRTRTLDEASLRQAVARRYGVEPSVIVAEYGMTELSSQLWSRELLDHGSASGASPSGFWIPPWVRVAAVDPATLAPLAEGERGLLRIDDLANLDSCVSIQTADVGVVLRDERGLRSLLLEGRDPSAVPRGCSLAIEEAMSWPGELS